MSLTLANYSEEYRDAVLMCLRRNFKWLNTLDDHNLNNWFDQIVKYEWKSGDSIKNLPYYHGAVVLSEKSEVVGFLGLIYSLRRFDERILTELNTTTWVVDYDSRDPFFLMTVCRELYKKNLYITDFSAIPGMQKLNERFKIAYIDRQSYICIKKMSIKNQGLQYLICTSKEMFDNDIIREEYIDHKKYGVRCVRYSSEKIGSQYVFYNVMRRNVLGIEIKWIQILKISDKNTFAQYFEQIVNSLMKIEKIMFVQCDHHFLGKKPDYKGIIREKKADKMARTEGIEDLSRVDYLYTELCMTDMYAGSDITLKKIVNKIMEKF